MLALTNANLIDGTGRQPLPDSTVVIDHGTFTEVGRGIVCPTDATVFNMRGLTVMPGLIDCHVHLGGFTIDKPGTATGRVSFGDMLTFFWDYARSYDHRRRLAIKNGVTTIRSAGDLYPHIVSLRDRIAAGSLPGPRIVTAGPSITAPGGHPASTIYKGNRYVVEHAVRQISETGVARDEVRRLVDGGVDWIKAIYSDIDPMDTSHRVPRLSLRVLEALADESHRHSIRLMVHTGGAGETLDALKVGADSIEHGMLPGGDSERFEDELVREMLDRQTYFVPTLATAWAYRKVYPQFFQALKETVRSLYEAGVKIAAGTDSGSPGVVIGKGLHRELQVMVESGIRSMDAIAAATAGAGDNLGRANQIGTIQSGKIADLIAVAGDPSQDIMAITQVKMVVQGGAIVLDHLK